MKLRESSLDIYAFIMIYRELLEGSFIKKIYQVSKSDFVIQLNIPLTGQKKFFISLTKGIAFYDAPRPRQPSNLSLLLRKRLSEKKILEIKQINFDRIIHFELSGGTELIVEMFREGNIIIQQDGVIVFALNPREWKNRKILIGETYRPPGDYDPLSLDLQRLSSIIRESKASIVQTLATRLNLGGEMAEEILYRMGIPKDNLASSFTEIEGIYKWMRKILELATLNNAYYYAETSLLSPIELTHVGTPATRVFNDLNDGIVYYLEHYPERVGEKSQLERRLESQKRTVREYREKADLFKNLGMYAMERLDFFSKLLKEINDKERTLSSGSELLNGTATVIKIDKGKKSVTVKLGDLEFPLYYNQKATINATRYFDLSKQLVNKALSAETAISNTLKEIETEEKKSTKRKRNRYWFESYRWFFTSENLLVISGKDRKTNERVVKKHMGQNDIYVHADVYGAPSTVIKTEGAKPGDASLREACQFAASMSRAWSAGVASSSAYWVYPYQVSKTPESGEFISKGSWVVRGKRNYIFNLPLELDINLIEYKGVTIPMIHPPFEENRGGGKAVRIKPGKTSRSASVKLIASILSVPVEEIEPLLPPGGSVVVEK